MKVLGINHIAKKIGVSPYVLEKAYLNGRMPQHHTFNSRPCWDEPSVDDIKRMPEVVLSLMRRAKREAAK